jgi:hypothetical protein
MNMDPELLKNPVEKDLSKVLFLPYVDGLLQKLKSLLRKRFGLDVLALRRTLR